ncbi:DUF6286 domain-containing protein [Glycomyces sp. YM15]|uniref:DUF6286 domain-containing protein n=1 Tax=Glycomyces sp. YM15 TaxID=2800446 RepID=UPI0019653CBA|nr:DUF6286 domain-containing protein [Glycomyces sp. YM15]
MKLRDPRRRPVVSTLAVLAALLLIGLAAVLAQHAASERGWTGADSWLRAALAVLDDPRPSVWVLTGGIAAALLGLWFLVAAFLPARRSHLPVDGIGDLWVSPRAVEALASDAAERTPGVLHAASEMRRRRLKVKALLAPEHEAAVADILEAVGARLHGIAEVEIVVQAKEANR